MILTVLKRIIIIAFYLSGYLAQAQNTDFDLRKLKDYSVYRLENGFTVINLQTGDSNHVALRLYTDIPLVTSKQYRAFIEVEHAFRKSNYLNLPSGWSSEKLKKLNIQLERDLYGYFLICPVKQLDTAVYLLSGFLKEPLLKASQLDEIKKQYTDSGSNAHAKNQPFEKITKEIIYGSNAPSRLRAGNDEINSLLISKYENQFTEFYRPNNSYLIFAGNVPEQKRLMLAQKYFSSLKKKEIPKFNYKLNEIREGRIAFFDSLPDNHYEISMIFPFSLHPFTFDYEKSELLSLLIQKILKQKLSGNNPLVSDIKAGFQNDKISGNYRLNLQLVNKNPAKVIEIIHQTIDELKQGIYPAEFLESSKQELIERFKKQGSDTKSLTRLIIKTEINKLSPEYYADFIPDIKNTGKEGIQSLAKKYLYYQASVLSLKAKWYPSLNDILELSKNYRIELYGLDGNIRKVIPKGFNGYHVLNEYISAIGGKNEIKKLKDLSLSIKGKYRMNEEEYLILGEIKHKAEANYYKKFLLVRPKKDTLLLDIQVYNGVSGIDSTMQGRKILTDKELDLLKYKSYLVPELHYSAWGFKTEILRADTINSSYVWVVRFSNPADQIFIDYYDVDTGIRYQRAIHDNSYFKDRKIIYKNYRPVENTKVQYPFYQEINTGSAFIQFVIEKADTKTRIDKKIFQIKP